MAEWIDGLLPLPVYLVLLLLGLGVRAWRKGRSAAKTRYRRQAKVWGMLAAWAWLMSAPATSNTLVGWLEQSGSDVVFTPTRDAQTLIVVLASGEFKPRLDLAGWERVHGGVKLWQQTGGRILMVGGPGTAAHNSLGGYMAQAAMDFGLSPAVVTFQGGGTNTHEDIVAATPEVLAHRGPVVLVTSALHMRRALATARHYGWQVQPYPVDHRYVVLGQPGRFLPANGGPDRMGSALHEVIGQWVYRWRGWSS